MSRADDKTFFLPGDLVTIRAELKEKPLMVVKGRCNIYIKDSELNPLKGIKCWWFTKNYELQHGIFHTKDLIHVENPTE